MTVTMTSELKGFYPDYSFPADEIVPDSLLLQVATTTQAPEGDQPVVRIPYIASDPTVGFVAEGAQIPEGDPGLDEILVHTKKLALTHTQSRESYTFPDAAAAVSTSLQRAITVAADNAFLNSVSDPTGLLNITGVINAGTITTTLDPILDGIAGIQQNYGNPSAIIIDPKSWAVLSKLKYADGVMQLGSPTVAASRTLFSLPVYITPSITAGNALIVSKSDLIAAVGTINLTTSAEAAFNADSLVHRIIWRIGWNTAHANRFAKVSITLPTSK